MAEVKQLQGEFQDAEASIRMLLEQTDEALVKAELYTLLISQATLTSNHHQAIAAGKQALALLGIELPEDMSDLQQAVEQHRQQVNQKLKHLSIPDLLDMPEATDRKQLLIIKLLNSLEPSTYLSEQEMLHWLITLKIIVLSCDHGMTAESANGLVIYGIHLESALGDYHTGYEYGKAAFELSLKFNDLNRIAQASYNLANKVHPWVQSLHTSQQLFDKSIQAALASGNFWSLGNALSDKLLHAFYEGRPLKTILENLLDYLTEVNRNKIQIAKDKILAL